MVSKEQIGHMAEICKLKFSEDEVGEFTGKFCDIVKYVGKINELDLEGVEATYQVNKHIQIFREDKVEEGLSKEEVLQNAPEEQYGYFKILKIVE